MTIYDIAKKAGVSAATVSRVINQKESVKEETRVKIEKLLKEYNFEVSEAARGLVKQSSKMIGILIADIRNQHHTEGVYVMEQEFLQKGYCSIILNTGETDEEKTSYIKILSSRRVEAAVLVGSTFQCEAVRQAILRYMPKIPIVIQNGHLDLSNVSEVVADDYQGVKSAVSYLFHSCKRKICFVNGKDTPSNLLKLKGYRDAVKELGLRERVFHGTDTYENGYSVTRDLFSGEMVDGIVYAVDILALGGLRYIQEQGFRIPDEVAFFGVDNSPFAEFSYPKISSVDNKLTELSEACASILLKALEEPGYTKKMLIPSQLALRETTGVV